MTEKPYCDAVASAVASRVGDDFLASEFVRLFWSKFPAGDLADRELQDDVGASIANWRVFAQRAVDTTTVSVSNPQHARDGWQSPHTVVRVLMNDAPFVVDSVLMVLSHGSLVTHLLGNVVYGVQRDTDGKLEACGVGRTSRDKEVFLYAEIDRVADDQLDGLARNIERTLQDVTHAVQDFAPMKTQAQRWHAQLREQTGEQAQECADFIAWLLDNHFTFLGYREFRYVDDMVEQVPDSALGILRGRRASSRRALSEQPDDVREFLLEPVLLSFSKSGTLSRVHRPAYPDYVGFRLLNEQGEVIGEQGFLGLYTSRVYLEHPASMPIVRRKVEKVIADSGLEPAGFDGKVLGQVLATYPRDELLQIDTELLKQHAMGITFIHERRRTRAFFRFDRYGLFVTCLVYLPRDLYNTDARTRIQALLEDSFDAVHSEFQPYFSESILVRLHFTLRVSPGSNVAVDVADVERQIVEITRDWQAELAGQAISQLGEVDGRVAARTLGPAFPPGYRDIYTPRNGLDDIVQLRRLEQNSGLVTHLFRLPEDQAEWLRLKLYHANVPLPLSDIIPALENMGLRVLGETAHMLYVEDGQRFSIQDFELRCVQALDLQQASALFEDSFKQIWHARVENDRFNQLTFSPGLTWQQVDMLRSFARYNKQLRFGFSLDFMADTLVKHATAAELFVRYFEARFDPAGDGGACQSLLNELTVYFDTVAVLNEDRILRRFCELMQATLRTNYFVEGRGALALKVAPRMVPNVPRPTPEFEIFVCAANMEGVHLRGGPIARGGLRWSDRLEDYRTEVLGLVKAQTVKNAVIVPVGAKGGFVVKQSFTGDRAKDGVSAYKEFIRGLLSVTDNLVAGDVVTPEQVRPADGADPYLVVAADKGTATFSDTANELAQEHGFWLDDAFASGGSHGYDHKKMGITARGAWVSVQRHFAERGIDVQTQPISVIGIGDMAGDVFGNGMLLSPAIQVVAAFNHMHIFIDPNPDAGASFAERKRLFELPRSSWSDYSAELISAGGGVFERSAKSIEITDEMKERFGLAHDGLSPDELIHELLKAPVDLIWNGGIGTYVRAAGETDDQVGDRANDAVRITASQLRCRVFGEGGNLGLTQAARVEFDLAGGGVNTDFIDNSAGVDCSDHEVNIKILLGELVAAGDLTMKHRNELLEQMTDAVAELVLHNNNRQAQTLSLAVRHSAERHDEYRRLMMRLEGDMALDRGLEALPTDEVLQERFAAGGELTRPELAVLLAYAKMQIKQQLAGSPILEDPHVRFLLESAFPAELVSRYPDSVGNHRLAREIMATQIANDLVHHVGLSFVMQMNELVGGTVEEIVRAYLIAAATIQLRERWVAIEALDVDESVRLEMWLELVRLARRSARWFLRHRRNDKLVNPIVQEFAPSIAELAAARGENMGQDTGERWQEQAEAWQAAGVDRALAESTANAGEFGAALAIVAAAKEHNHDALELAARYTHLGERLSLGWLTTQISSLPTDSHWQAMERDSVLDEVTTHQGVLAARTLAGGESLDAWLAEHQPFERAWCRVMEDVQGTSTTEFSMYAMTCRKLTDLCRTLS